MEYAISFTDVMAYVIPGMLGLLIYLIKRWFRDVETRDHETRVQMEQGNREIQEQIEKNDKRVNERINKLEEKTGNDIQHIQQEINDIKGDFSTTFVLREDFFRSMNGVEDKIKGMDGKLDRLLLMGREK